MAHPQYFPKFYMVMNIEEWPEGLRKREHNKFAKQAARKVMEHHAKRNWPKHFKREARKKYGYMPRTVKYIREKQRRYRTGGMDLVKTGGNRKYVPSHGKVRLGGTASADKKPLVASLSSRFSFPGGSGRFRKPESRQAVTIGQMIKEMQAVTTGEAFELSGIFSDEYWRRVRLLSMFSPKRTIKTRIL